MRLQQPRVWSKGSQASLSFCFALSTGAFGGMLSKGVVGHGCFKPILQDRRLTFLEAPSNGSLSQRKSFRCWLLWKPPRHLSCCRAWARSAQSTEPFIARLLPHRSQKLPSTGTNQSLCLSQGTGLKVKTKHIKTIQKPLDQFGQQNRSIKGRLHTLGRCKDNASYHPKRPGRLRFPFSTASLKTS